MIAQFAAAVSGDREKALPVPTVRKLGDVPIPRWTSAGVQRLSDWPHRVSSGKSRRSANGLGKCSSPSARAAPPAQRLGHFYARQKLSHGRYQSGPKLVLPARNARTSRCRIFRFAWSCLLESRLGSKSGTQRRQYVPRAMPLYLQQYSTGDDLAADLPARQAARAAFAAPRKFSPPPHTIPLEPRGHHRLYPFRWRPVPTLQTGLAQDQAPRRAMA